VATNLVGDFVKVPFTLPPVTHRGLTFVEAIQQKLAKVTDIDDWVEAWHICDVGEGKELREYLGFSKELYGAWMRTGPDALMSLME
jgi:hypothetical protein